MPALLPFLLAATASVAAAPPVVATAGAVRPANRCVMPGGWPEIVRERPRYVLLGEVHGTRESPAFFGTVTCALARRGERLLIALEIDSMHDAALQAAWRLPADRFATALRGIGWAGGDDGRASHAMYALLVRLHDLKARGLPIAVVAFNGVRDASQAARLASLPGQGAHDAAQAENIRIAAAAGDYDRVLVLVGNIHAGKRPVGDGAARFDPMAVHLARDGRVVSLNMRDAGGSGWACVPKVGRQAATGQMPGDDAIECGIHSWRSVLDLKRAPFMRIGAFPHEEPSPDYDGFFWVGPVSGSPPLAAG